MGTFPFNPVWISCAPQRKKWCLSQRPLILWILILTFALPRKRLLRGGKQRFFSTDSKILCSSNEKERMILKFNRYKYFNCYPASSHPWWMSSSYWMLSLVVGQHSCSIFLGGASFNSSSLVLCGSVLIRWWFKVCYKWLSPCSWYGMCGAVTRQSLLFRWVVVLCIWVRSFVEIDSPWLINIRLFRK